MFLFRQSFTADKFVVSNLIIKSTLFTVWPDEHWWTRWSLFADIFKCISWKRYFVFWFKFRGCLFPMVQFIVSKSTLVLATIWCPQATRHYNDVIMSAMAFQITMQLHDCLLNRLFMRRSKKTSKLGVTGLCAGNSPGTGEFPAQIAVTRKMFPFDDVIMGYLTSESGKAKWLLLRPWTYILIA